MDNPLWDRLPADVRLHVDGLILAGRKPAAIAAILDGAPAPRPGLPGSVQVIAGRYGDLGLRFQRSPTAPLAYRAAGIAIPRASQEQWGAGPWMPPGREEPGDLVFFAGPDGTVRARPGRHLRRHGLMIGAPYSGVPVRVDPAAGAVGFTRPAAA